jgi:ABC-2 type transport system ATP-binding protein
MPCSTAEPAPDAGTARVLGHDVASEAAAVRRAIALAGQSATVDGDLNGRENLVFLGWLAGAWTWPPA